MCLVRNIPFKGTGMDVLNGCIEWNLCVVLLMLTDSTELATDTQSLARH